MASDSAAMPGSPPSLPRRALLRRAGAAAMGAALPWAPARADRAPFADPLSRPATIVEGASRCVLLGLAKAGQRLVACGERGIIVYSDNAGGSWRQAQVPVSVTLTAVSFPQASQGWAVGHGGVVLHSADGGATWVRQTTGGTESERERVLLDVRFDDDKTGIAVGAFGVIMRT
ncbi:MAG TPA: YCF48-related protein, partial [Steroidobacteraceae bacterium]|nr:YCF48-related protein [Steroidobacteraceae bacterium]